MAIPRLLLELFGGLRAVPRGGEPIVFAPQKTGSLLAYLALNLEKTHVREELIVLLWPEDDVEEGRRKLRQRLFSLRQQIEQAPDEAGRFLLTTRSTVRLNPDAVHTDVSSFEGALRAASDPKIDLSERAVQLNHAVDLYQGDLLPGFYLDEFVSARSRLAQIHRGAVHNLAMLYEETGAHDLAVDAARKAVSLDPLMEEAHRTLIRLFAAAGQPVSALRQYQELERVLLSELGEAPSEKTRRLIESLRQNGSGENRTVAQPGRTIGPSASDASPTPDAANDRGILSESLPIAATPAVRSTTSFSSRRAPLSHLWKVALSAAACVALALWLHGRRHVPRRSIQLAPSANPEIGHEKWVARYTRQPGDSAEGGAEPTAVAVDGSGNSYVTGFVRTIKSDVDFLTLKYDPQGHLVWEARYDGTGHDVDRARCISTDQTGNVYVTGESDNGKGNGTTRLAGTDFATVKYGPDGKPSPTWPDVGFGIGVRRYNGPGDGEDRPVQLAVDPHGSVYVLGSSWGRGKTGRAGTQIALVKYDAAGRQQWAGRYDGGCGSDVPAGMVVDADGIAYVTGTSRVEPASGPEADVVTLKYDQHGRLLWCRRYGENNKADDIAKAIGWNGNMINVFGNGRGTPGTPDADRIGSILVSYDANGTMRWARGTYNESDRISAVSAVFPFGSGLVAGHAVRPEGKDGVSVLRVAVRDAGGMPLWTRDLAPNAGGIAVCVTSGLLRLDTVVPQSGGRFELATLRFDANIGTILGQWVYRDPKGLNWPVAAAMDGDCRSTVALQSVEGDIVLLRYQY